MKNIKKVSEDITHLYSTKFEQAYGIFIEEGVNGTKLKRGSKYSFKKKFVNIAAIEKYVKSGKFDIKINSNDDVNVSIYKG